MSTIFKTSTAAFALAISVFAASPTLAGNDGDACTVPTNFGTANGTLIVLKATGPQKTQAGRFENKRVFYEVKDANVKPQDRDQGFVDIFEASSGPAKPQFAEDADLVLTQGTFGKGASGVFDAMFSIEKNPSAKNPSIRPVARVEICVAS